MAAQVLVLLLPLISNIHAELILGAGYRYPFDLDDTADFCSVSRWTSEGKQLLWNSSGSYYWLHPLTVSHSGQYQAQCWTRGNVTLERNSTLLVCDHRRMKHQYSYLDIGQTLKLTCDGVGPNQSVQWGFVSYRSHGLVLIDGRTFPEQQFQLVENKLLLTATKHSMPFSYLCLEKQQLRCELHSAFYIEVLPEYIFRSVGESLELNCSNSSPNQTHRWKTDNSVWLHRLSLNSTLMFPSLTLNHSGNYTCGSSLSGYNDYSLYVCPEPGPPAVELFTGGENLTLHCGDRTDAVHWFMRSNRTEGRVFNIFSQRPDHMYPSGRRLVIRNVSLQDSGQFWCVVKRDGLCVFRSDFLVMFGEPEVDHHLLRSVLLSAVVLMMLGVVVGVKVWRSRRREQVPAPAEELEMSQLSPEPDVQEEAPV